MGLGDAVAIASARGLTKIYGRGDAAVHALAGVDVDLVQGEFTAIMGPSGSGKSTLMHCLAGLDRPTSGTVEVAGEDITHLGERALTKLRRTRLGFVFQAFNLVPTLSARENIRLPVEIARARVDEEWFETVVRAVGLEGRLDHRPAELSGGEQQRVACARALITKPALVFADEPTGNLDSAASAEVLGFLRRSVDELRQSVVMVTHEPYAAAHADRVLFLSDGVIVGEVRNPTPESVLDAIRKYAALPPVPHSAAMNIGKFSASETAFGSGVDSNALEPATSVVPDLSPKRESALSGGGVAAAGLGAAGLPGGLGADLAAPFGAANAKVEPRWKPQPPISPSGFGEGQVNVLGQEMPASIFGPFEPPQPASPLNAPVVYRDTKPAGIEKLLDVAKGPIPPAMPAVPAVPGHAVPPPGPPTLVGQIPPIPSPSAPASQLAGQPAPGRSMSNTYAPRLQPAPPSRPPGGRPAAPGPDATGLMPAIPGGPGASARPPAAAPMANPSPMAAALAAIPGLGAPATQAVPGGSAALAQGIASAAAVGRAGVQPSATLAPAGRAGSPAPPAWSPGGSVASRVQVGGEPVTMVHPAVQVPVPQAAPMPIGPLPGQAQPLAPNPQQAQHLQQAAPQVPPGAWPGHSAQPGPALAGQPVAPGMANAPMGAQLGSNPYPTPATPYAQPNPQAPYGQVQAPPQVPGMPAQPGVYAPPNYAQGPAPLPAYQPAGIVPPAGPVIGVQPYGQSPAPTPVTPTPGQGGPPNQPGAGQRQQPAPQPVGQSPAQPVARPGNQPQPLGGPVLAEPTPAWRTEAVSSWSRGAASQLPEPSPAAGGADRAVVQFPQQAPRPAWAPEVEPSPIVKHAATEWAPEKPAGLLGLVKTGSGTPSAPQFSGPFFNQASQPDRPAQSDAAAMPSAQATGLPADWRQAVAAAAFESGLDVWPSPGTANGNGSARRRRNP